MPPYSPLLITLAFRIGVLFRQVQVIFSGPIAYSSRFGSG